MWHRKKARNILVIEPMTGVDSDSEMMRLLSGRRQSFDLIRSFFLSVVMLGKGPRMQLNKLSLNFSSRFNLFWFRIDEQTHFNVRIAKTSCRSPQRLNLAGCVEPAFGSHFRSLFRDETNDVRLHS